ncbi:MULTISPECIES: hypothetical protein [unclassified Amycolatopsis]|uniref:hypothetical protein n=1 Tax=unclassified Amycolatopsis TaxID=2618356 RepID=UPI00287668E1|nr:MULTISPECIES: hypothetical protein [unclassified Amycolatopsis]MDS0138451.1 hypothetical protein [Amycolatopsis sp. 505]MDS0146272.1 hypothetical protein [Amycolatopsis sp. CM201R]
MGLEGWIEPITHIKATGQVSGGKMTGATVEDSNGTTIDRNRTFASKAAFLTWARQRKTY